MSQPVSPFSINAPSFYGINLSDSPVEMAPSFALQADNCVIDKAGRTASRNGWSKAHTANADLGTSSITCIGECIQNDGTATTLATGNGFLFKLSGTTLTTLTYGGGGVAPTISANNWKFCQMNGVAMFWQRGYDPLIYDPAVSTTTYRRLNERSGSAGTIYQCNEAISAYGRVWAADTTTDKNTVVWSDLLTPHIWTGGSSGSLNLIGVWPSGGDEVVALAAHNNFLFIFGRWQILIYQGASTPSTMTLQDTIVGVGCIARDSVQTTGEDIWFLSDRGLLSLQRTIQEKSAPFRQLSKNLAEDFVLRVNQENTDNIKSGYSATNNFYIITLPVSLKSYCFDTRSLLPDGSAKITSWSLIPTAFYETKGRKFYLGRGGYVGLYGGYIDDATAYRMAYYTTWLDFGNPIQTSILKKILLTLIGGVNQAIVFKWAYDFSSVYSTDTAQVSSAVIPSEYGIAEYGIAEYGPNQLLDVLSVQGSGSGQTLQFGFEASVSVTSISIQKVSLYTKDGRLK